MNNAVRYAIANIVVIFLFLPTCALIRPEGLTVNNGISYFGVYKSTILPYTIALITCAYSYIQIANTMKLNLRYGKTMGLLCKLVAFSFIGLLLAPRSTLGLLHVGFATLLFLCQFILSICILRIVKIDKINILLMASEVLSGMMIIYFMPLPSGLLLHAQVLFQTAFGFLLIRFFVRQPLRVAVRRYAAPQQKSVTMR